MAGISPTNQGSTTIHTKPPEELPSKTAGLGLFFFSKDGPLVKAGLVFIQVTGKPFLAIGVYLILDSALDHFSSPPYRTAFKVTLFVLIGIFIIVFLVRKIEEINKQIEENKRQIKENGQKNNQLDFFNAEIEINDGKHNDISEALAAHFLELRKRRQLVKEKIVLDENTDRSVVFALKECQEQIAALKKDLDKIHHSIELAVDEEVQTVDDEEFIEMIPSDLEQQTQILEARKQKIAILQLMIACYDLFFKKIGIVTETAV